MRLTKKTKEDFFRRYNGYGMVFIKTGDKEVTEIEIYRDRTGKLRTINGTLLTERLNELATTIPEEGD